MIIPTRGKYLCEVMERARQLSSGLWLAEKMKEEKKDNVCRCLGVGDPEINNKGKAVTTIARRTDIIHYKRGFGKKITYEGRKYIFLRNQDIVAIERGPHDYIETENPQDVRSYILKETL